MNANQDAAKAAAQSTSTDLQKGRGLHGLMSPGSAPGATSLVARRQRLCRSLGLLLLGGLWLLLASCGPQGSGSLSGDLQVGDCTALAQKAAWQLEAGFVALTVLSNRETPIAVELRLQMYPGPLTHRDVAPQDLLVISISNPLKIQTGQAIPIEAYEARLVAEPKGSDPTRVTARAIFSLGETCPSLPHPMTFALQGQITFSSFQIVEGASIAGNITLQVGPARPSSPATDGSLQGSFQLTYNPPTILGDEQVGYIPTQ